MKKIWVTGGSGQLGSEIRDVAGSYTDCHFIFTDVGELDLTDYDAVERFVQDQEITALINCAAYTAVDQAETQVEQADAINHRAVAHLAQMTKQYGLTFIHISTDYVFDGRATAPYKESDIPNPQSVYGRTKWDGERAILEIAPPDTAIIRTSWLYSGHGSNFVKTMLRLGGEKKEINVVNDQIGSPTYAADLARAILAILPQLKTGSPERYHYANVGQCTWYELAHRIFELVQMPAKAKPITTAAYPTPAPRPMFSVLDTQKIKRDFGLVIPEWEESLWGLLKSMVEAKLKRG